MLAELRDKHETGEVLDVDSLSKAPPMLGGMAGRGVSSANLGAPQPLTREGKSAVRQENLANNPSSFRRRPLRGRPLRGRERPFLFTGGVKLLVNGERVIANPAYRYGGRRPKTESI